MISRPNRARSSRAKPGIPGGPQLTFAHLIVTLENILRNFARPLLLAGFFVALAFFGVFRALYPWAHLATLVLLTLFFFEALGRARKNWKPVSFSAAKRRVEEASSLSHRPLDVIEDRPVAPDSEQMALWQTHAAHAREQVQKLRWPRWKLDLSEKDPYALRYALLILLAIGAVTGWGVLGGRLLSAINPALGRLHLEMPTLDAWITPPEYTHLPPLMIATPAGLRDHAGVIDIPAGSTITAHVFGTDGDVPELLVNGAKTGFAPDDHQGYGATATVQSGDRIAIRRGWETLGSWTVRVMPDKAPQIALTAPPSASEQKSLRVAYKATDDYGVTSVAMQVTPKESLPGVSDKPVDVNLAHPDSKTVDRVSFEDLTSSPWAGLPVQITLIATDAAGHKAESVPAEVVLPERVFFNPIARALIAERKKLLQSPDDDSVRNEVANVMAGIAHQPADYRGDPVVLLALRTGAVRLVLDRGEGAIMPVSDLLWQTAIRIEDGATGMAEQNLREAQKELADALDRNASEQEINRLIDKLHQALAQYLAELSMRMAPRPGPIDGLSQLLGPHTNMLTPQDLDRMLEQMRTLSATGSRGAARAELQRMQQLLESLQTERPQLSEQQKEAIQNLLALRQLAQQQQKLMDKTYQSAEGSGKTARGALTSEQEGLLSRLQALMGKTGDKGRNLARAGGAMKSAGGDLRHGEVHGAVRDQGEAVAALQQALQDMASDLRASMMMLPMPGAGMASGADPFGRGAMLREDDSVKVPDRMQVRKVREILDELQRRAGESGRSKTERDYIERLLRNF